MSGENVKDNIVVEVSVGEGAHDDCTPVSNFF